MHFNLAASGLRMSRAWCKKATQAVDKYALLGMGGSKNEFRGEKNLIIPFVENCPDVTNCDLLGHCISLGQDKGETLSLGRTLAAKITRVV